jgi:hypothetical protein
MLKPNESDVALFFLLPLFSCRSQPSQRGIIVAVDPSGDGANSMIYFLYSVGSRLPRRDNLAVGFGSVAQTARWPPRSVRWSASPSLTESGRAPTGSSILSIHWFYFFVDDKESPQLLFKDSFI